MSHQDASLNAARRARDLAALRDGEPLDVLVVGGGVTGAGTALDAASRGLRVALVERRDLAWGTSRWSSKLVHGGLRYLAQGAVDIARESAVERGILLARTAPHLVRALPVVVPLVPALDRRAARETRIGFALGDGLRRAAGTRRALLPRARRVSPAEALRLAPGVRRHGLRGALVGWDAQLEDDARLVVALARTAAAHDARVVTRCGAAALAGDGARLRDELTGETFEVSARAVVNATGVWAGELVDGLALRPSRGSHVVIPAAALGGLTGTLNAPVPGERHRWVFAVGQPNGLAYIGLTDEPVDGAIPDVPEAPEADVSFLLATMSTVLHRPLTRDDVLSTYAGLRPLLAGGESERTADLSRRHAVVRSGDGVLSVVGGKLTTYRRMAQDAVDAVVEHAGLHDLAPCRTAALPLVGAAPPAALATLEAPRRLVDRHGTEAPAVLALAGGDADLLEPVADGADVLGVELLHALRHEGALDADDLLDRRTRLGLVPAWREQARALAEALVERERAEAVTP
jgi:glycerol-3-phosphate dehydrogenase